MKKTCHSATGGSASGGKYSAFCILHSAFSLVELMVVMAVMAVLIMLLLPVLKNARERARSTACQNNLRQYGVAIGRYMSDWKGYFIYPGEGGGNVMYSTTGPDVSTYQAGIGAAAGGISVSQGQWWPTFIAGYLPKIMETNYAHLINSVSSVQICPSLQQELRKDNYFDPKSPAFKGYRAQLVYQELCDVANFEDRYDDNNNLILANYFTTYAINNYLDVYRADRRNISANTIAFIDWNAKEGWQCSYYDTDATLYRSTNTWQFTTPVGKIPFHSQNDFKWTTNWCLTEVGFHHKDGTNAYANYVAMGGHVASVSSNQINVSYFSKDGPR